jgi:hypothetical protein
MVTSALGQKQPLNSIQILASEWLLSGYTGHSPLRISGDASGCFRPQAALRDKRKPRHGVGVYSIALLRGPSANWCDPSVLRLA